MSKLSLEQQNCFQNLKWSIENDTPLSNRGVTKYSPELKSLKELPKNPYEKEDFTYLAKGIDSLQECFNVKIKSDIQKHFEDKKKEAVLEGGPVVLKFDMPFFGHFQMQHFATKGFKYFIQNQYVELFFGNMDTEWSFSVRYLSSALWQFGVDFLRQQVHVLVNELSKPLVEDYHRLSRVDICLDFKAKGMSSIMKPSLMEGVVVPSKVRVAQQESLSFYLKYGRLTTLTIGSKSSLEIQIYDKAREISEKSKKEFMFDIWSKECPELKNARPKSDIWRFEVRYFSSFLRNRAIKTYEEFDFYQRELLSEAFYRRRICQPNGDKNRSRWGFHPLYSFLMDSILAKPLVLPIGRVVTGYRTELVNKGYKQIAGTIRSLNVLKNHGIFDEHSIYTIVKMSLREIQRDKKHSEKIDKAKERYRFVDVA